MTLLRFLVLTLCVCSAAAQRYQVTTFYSDNETACADTPTSLYIEANASCGAQECVNSVVYQGSMNSAHCTTDFQTDVAQIYSNTSNGYLIEEFYNDSDCTELSYVEAEPLITDGCLSVRQKYYSMPVYRYITNSSNSVTVEYFYDDVCSSAERYRSITASYDECTAVNVIVETSTGVVTDGYVIFRSDDSTAVVGSGSSKSAGSSDSASGSKGTGASGATGAATDSSGLKAGAIIGIVVGAVAVVALVLAIIMRRRKHRGKDLSTDTPRYLDPRAHVYRPSPSDQQETGSLQSTSLQGALRGQVGLWDDDVITAARIPRDKVRVQRLINRGAYGEVYTGVFNDQQVAIKMLPPETRKSIPHVNAFLAEVKTTAAMEHPSIVTFLGVAWDSLTDLCVVMEFMDGGDLRTLLNQYQSSGHPVGFDRQKTTIALQVCHALTYMHSLSPPVIHRDLKSRNILLSRDMRAKLTDFGISRERLDQTMTAGVGTSLWMAPEVMLGEKYDEKADIFSFGVVLSELIVHTMPYANSNTHGDALILQNVAIGKLSVEFSPAGPKAMVELGRACVAVNPMDRPTAAEALYRLQVVIREEF